MEAIEVPEVRQLPELSGQDEDPVAFADMVLTCLLGYENALLYAEYRPGEESVSWRIEPREETVPTHEVEVAVSPSCGSFQSVLARFGHHYMSDQLYNGYALRFLRQGDRVKRCHLYMSSAGQSGFWIRVYATNI